MPRTYIIAEIGVNHNGSLDIAKEMIKAAAACGADAVKFQTFKTENLVTQDAQQADYQKENTGKIESQFDMLKRLELSADDHQNLMLSCQKRDIDFLSSAFDIESAEFLINELGLKTIKLGSGELTNAPLLHTIAKNQAHIILSTGMATLEEIREALGVLSLGYKGITPNRREDLLAGYDLDAMQEKVTLLHCTSNYPAAPGTINLKAMNALAAEFGLPVGYSDHSTGAHISIAAAALGASVIEKHFTLDISMDGPDHKASMVPGDFKKLVAAIRDIEKALGDGVKTFQKAEAKTKAVARKSIVATVQIPKGEIFTPQNITTKRPEKGVSPFDYWDILGKKALRTYAKDDMIASHEE